MVEEIFDIDAASKMGIDKASLSLETLHVSKVENAKAST